MSSPKNQVFVDLINFTGEISNLHSPLLYHPSQQNIDHEERKLISANSIKSFDGIEDKDVNLTSRVPFFML